MFKFEGPASGKGLGVILFHSRKQKDEAPRLRKKEGVGLTPSGGTYSHNN